MGDLAKKYYEDPAFWEGGMLQDPRNMERFKYTYNLIPPDARSILDAGCGNGVFINLVAEERPDMEVHALDWSQEALKYVKTAKTLGDVSHLPFDDNTFDCVACLEVIEHLPIEAYEQALNELTRVSRKYVLISVPYNEILEDSYTCCPSCKTIFNWELHLRSFNDDLFHNLLKSRGYRNVKTIKAGGHRYLKYHKNFRKIFYPEQFLIWNSPICPLCGFAEKKVPVRVTPDKHNEQQNNGKAKPRRKLISFISILPKLFWPRELKYYWIIGLFEKDPSIKWPNV